MSFSTERPSVLISMGELLTAGASFTPHEQYIRLLILTSGQATLSDELATIYVDAGDVVILRAEDHWQVSASMDMKCIDLYCRMEFLLPALRQFTLKLGFRVLFQFELAPHRSLLIPHALWNEMGIGFDPEAAAQEKHFSQIHLDPPALNEVVRICSDMQTGLTERLPYYEVMLLSQLLHMATLFFRAYLNGTKLEEDSQDYQAIHEITQLLLSEYARQWQLDDLCAIAHMSRSKLVSLFNEATGKTPIEYLIFVRLTTAVKLLRNTSKSITDIAFETGFSDSNYFARLFKKYTGTTPSQYRKQFHRP